MAERRPARVAQLIRSELAGLLLREVGDPRLRALTVADVRISPDLRVARVFVRELGREADERALLEALERALPFLRSRLGAALPLRYVPELRFEVDHLLEEASRIEELLADPGPDDEETT